MYLHDEFIKDLLIQRVEQLEKLLEHSYSMHWSVAKITFATLRLNQIMLAVIMTRINTKINPLNISDNSNPTYH